MVPLVALAIRQDSPGPVFFLQKRSGKHCRTFTCIKFRTMFLNPDAHRLQVQPGDTRITPVGRVLRRYYIDELPQLLNVLGGSMSLVGPRPHMLRHTVEFARLIGNYGERHRVRPGLTGLAQVRGYHGMVSTQEDLFLRTGSDLEYIARWSLFTDLKIIALTFFRICQRISGRRSR